MLSFIFRRFLTAIPTLFLIITISFFLVRLAPGGPFDLERPLEAKVMENLNRIYKLDRSLFEQYLLYLGAIARGDFGPSFILRDFSVAELFARGLPVSMTLGALAMILAVVIGRHARHHRRLSAEQPHRLSGHRHRRLRPHHPDLRGRPSAADPVRPCPRLAAGRGLERRLSAQSHPAGHHPGPTADRRGRAHDPGRDDRELALQSYPDPAVARPPVPHHRPACLARRRSSGGVLSRAGRRRAPYRLRGGRDDLQPSGRRALLRRGAP